MVTTAISASIISYYVSAISYFHTINGFQDPAKSFIISRLLVGAHNLRTVSDVWRSLGELFQPRLFPLLVVLQIFLMLGGRLILHLKKIGFSISMPIAMPLPFISGI